MLRAAMHTHATAPMLHVHACAYGARGAELWVKFACMVSVISLARAHVKSMHANIEIEYGLAPEGTASSRSARSVAPPRARV